MMRKATRASGGERVCHRLPIIAVNLAHEVRTTPALGFGYVYAGCDTGRTLWQLQSSDLSRDENGEPFPQTSHKFDAPFPEDYFVGSAALTNTGNMADSVLYTGNDNGYLYARRSRDVSLALDTAYHLAGSRIRSTPAIAYIEDELGNLDRWVYATSAYAGGGIVAFKTDRGQ